MNDCVSRKWLLDKYDEQHEGPPGKARKLIEEAPSKPVILAEGLTDGAIRLIRYCPKIINELASKLLDRFEKFFEGRI